MFEQVLVPLDGSELAEGILPYVSQLAHRIDAKVLLLSVVDPLKSSETAGFTLRRELEEVERRLIEEGIEAASIVSYGDPADQIMRVADVEGCDLIAMATHGRGALGRVFHGSVTDRVVRHSRLPTLAIFPNETQGLCEGWDLPRVIIPLDGSSLAETALPYAEELAGKLGLELVVVRVIDTGGPTFGWLDDARYVDVDPEIEAKAVEYLAGVTGRLQAKGLKVQSRLLKGAPGQELLGLAHETQDNIIVTTTHGRKGLDRWVEGSVADTLIRYSSSPVLVISPNIAERLNTAVAV